MTLGRKQLSRAEIERIAELREAGETYAAIGAAVGASESAVAYHCRILGAESPNVPVRRMTNLKTYIRNARPVRPFTPDEDRKLTRLARAGKSYRQIAQCLGRPINSVRLRLVSLARFEEAGL